jgi:hypothetical protein
VTQIEGDKLEIDFEKAGTKKVVARFRSWCGRHPVLTNSRRIRGDERRLAIAGVRVERWNSGYNAVHNPEPSSRTAGAYSTEFGEN